MNKIFKIILSTSILILLVGVLFTSGQADNKLHIYFCDVGQGDAVYIRFPDGEDMLIDGGPGNKVLDCLSRHMPFFDREINLVLLTHPQEDHLSGLISVLERYSVQYFVSSPAGNSSLSYQKLIDLINKKKIETKNLFSGEGIDFQSVHYQAIWPQKDWVIAHLNCGVNNCTQLASGNSPVLGVQSTDPDLNDFSVMGILSYGSFDALFTGDGGSKIQDNILKLGGVAVNDQNLEVMKVPHHGSKTALNSEFLKTFKPALAVISVGKNSFGHPTSETINSLKALGATVERTDQEGDIEVVSDGKTWSTN